MRWLVETLEGKEKRLGTPHQYYAWFPVRITHPVPEDRVTVVWRETVWRRRELENGWGERYWRSSFALSPEAFEEGK